MKLRHALRGLVCTLLLAGLGGAQATLAQSNGQSTGASPTSGPGDEKLRQIMQRARAQPGAIAAPNDPAIAGPSAQRLQERHALLAQGESALAELQTEKALHAFERAALILHAADTEIALVRAYMQGGEYRRALAFGAHTAGAHLDVIGGAALYAWLLHLGAQVSIADRLLSEAEARRPGSLLIKAVRQQLGSKAPLAGPELLGLPTRLAPYSLPQAFTPGSKVLGSGLLLPGGRKALVPAGLLPRSGRIWLRNGLGQVTSARIISRLPTSEMLLLSLAKPLPAPEELVLHTREAFPGSAAYTAEFVASTDAAPAWPVLRSGFLGGFAANGKDRKLGVDMPPGKRGGPVFDAAGRLIGMAIGGQIGEPDRFVSSVALGQALPGAGSAAARPVLGASVKPSAAPASPDQIYETALKATLQVIGRP